MRVLIGKFGARASYVRESAAGGLLFAIVCAACVVAPLAGCERIGDKLRVSVRPRALHDVPAARLAYRLEADVDTNVLPESVKNEGAEEPVAAVRTQFETNRKEEALLRTVTSPDGLRVLALYVPNDPAFPADEFLVDLYGADGLFVRNVLPAGLSGVFPSAVAWSPDSQWIAFTGRRTAKPTPSPTPISEPLAPDVTDPNAPPTPMQTVAPLIAPVATYRTEQVYLADRDGFNLRPLTSREGLVYFHVAWSPDGYTLAALACREDELAERINENKQLAGRPRLIDREGRERLLSDQLMDALPVWSPDGSKIATAAETDVSIYDAAGERPTAALLPLRDPLLAASAEYDAKHPSARPAAAVRAGAPKGPSSAPTQPVAPTSGGTPLSFNPVVRLEWVQPELLLVQTGFIRIFQNEPEPTRRYLRWHVLHLSPQAAVLQ